MTGISRQIEELKERLGDSVCIMGHHYQADDVASHCDIMGDSLELARKIPEIQAEHIVFCGVYFMGETAALLAGQNQKVHLPEPDADCMMSLQASGSLAEAVLGQLEALGRKVVPLAYVNTMLGLKDVVGAHGGAVCTSANAPRMLKWALERGDSVLFLPDKNLGRNTAASLGIPNDEQYVLRLRGSGLLPGQEGKLGAKVLLWPGCCAVHAKLAPGAVEKARQASPDCVVLAHPECRPDLIERCDGAGSTSYLIKEAERLALEKPGTEVVIGTEENLVHRLAGRFRESLAIRPLGRATCPHMEKVTPDKLLKTLSDIAAGTAQPLKTDPLQAANAKLSIDRMLAACQRN